MNTQPATEIEPAVDQLRAIAVTLVFLRHYLGWLSPSWIPPKVLQLTGIFGVVVFFVITSYVLTASLIRTNDQSTGNLWTKFQVRRIFRIYPLAAIAIIATIVTTSDDFSLPQIASNLLLIQNLTGFNDILGPLWSLPIEVQMYLFLPLLFFTLSKKILSPVKVYLLVVLIGIFVVYIKIEQLSVLAFAPIFIVGLFAKLNRTTNIGISLQTKRYVSTLSMILAYMCYMLLGRYSQTLAAYPTALLIGLSLATGRPTGRVLQETFRWISKLSYGIYLFHALVIIWLIELKFEPTFATFSVLVGVTLLLSIMAHYLIEEPFIRLGFFASSRLGRTNKIEAKQLPRTQASTEI